MKDIAIVVLAAGKGTRMQSQIPKVMHQITFRPMVEHVYQTANRLSARPKKIITVINRDMNPLLEYFSEYGEVTVQDPPRGTADAVKQALPHLHDFKGHVLILYADTPLLEASTLDKMLEKLNSQTSLCALSFIPDDAAQYGRLIVNNEGLLERIVEYKDANERERGIRLCNSGVIAVKATLLPALLEEVKNHNASGEFYLTDIIQIANEKGHQCSYIEAEEDEVLGVNTRAQLSKCESILQKRYRESAMRQGATLLHPESVYFASDMKLGRDIVIHPNVVFGNDVIIEDGVEILPFSHISGAHIGANSSIGPFARIRPGADIGENVKIGNFVEIKKAEVGDHTKISHLSYIGDSIIGEHSNIGAGTITCNYDGVNKHHTTIGNHVFVGSNTSLVAPVSIGDNSVIGAGSTITKDIEPKSLAIARNRQVNKVGWTSEAPSDETESDKTSGDDASKEAVSS